MKKVLGIKTRREDLTEKEINEAGFSVRSSLRQVLAEEVIENRGIFYGDGVIAQVEGENQKGKFKHKLERWAEINGRNGCERG